MSRVLTRVDSFSSDSPVVVGLERAPEEGATSNASPSMAPSRMLNRMAVLKALVAAPRLTIIELCCDGRGVIAADLIKPLKLNSRRVSEHLQILRRSGLMFRIRRADRRELEHAIPKEFLRLEADGSRIVDFGSGALRFPPANKPA